MGLEIKNTKYGITNLTENYYRFVFQNTKVKFEPFETKVIDLSNTDFKKEPDWKMGLQHLLEKKDPETEELIFEIQEIEE